MDFLVAIVAGVVGSIGVVIGVYLAPRVTDGWNAKHRVATIASELTDLMTRFCLPFVDPATGFNTEWMEGSNRISMLLVDLRTAAGSLRKEQGIEVIAALNQMMELWFAAQKRLGAQKLLATDLTVLYGAMSDLNHAVGRTSPFDDEARKRVDWLSEHGLDSGGPHADGTHDTP